MGFLGVFFAVIFILSFYGGTNFYIGARLFQGLSILFPQLNVKIYAVIYILVSLSIVIGFLPMPASIKGIISWISAHWMGVFVYLLILFLVADLVILLGSIVKVIPSPSPPSLRFYVGLIVVVLTTGLVSYGIYNANQIKQVSYEIKMKNKDLEDEMKIVLISDLHLGAVNSEKRLDSMVQGINNLEPDIVCLAGDIFNDDYYAIGDPEAAMELLKGIEARYGVYGSLGNHDGGKTFHEMVRFLELSNIKLLNDEHVIIDDRLVLLGRVDPSPIGGFQGLKRKDIAEILPLIDTNIPIVVMDHKPSSIDEYGGEIDLILAGHTHQGQIFPFNFVTNAIFTVDYGYYQKDADSPHVIVTSGVSTWGMPMRVGTNNEIVSILLH